MNWYHTYCGSATKSTIPPISNYAVSSFQCLQEMHARPFFSFTSKYRFYSYIHADAHFDDAFNPSLI
jgi:hypothetical protein